MRVPVYLASSALRDRAGADVLLLERRLIRRNLEDRVIAVVLAPAGSKIRRKRDDHGPDQLFVPVSTATFWSRWFGPKVAIPAKYVISSARRGDHGLALAEPLLA